MPSNTNNDVRTKPHATSLHHLGYITGLTHTSTTTNQTLCHSYTGIPYALPPLGPYRFRKPRPLPACYRYGTRSNPGNFTGPCSVCPQPAFPGTKPHPDEDELDEDCLQLNVWVPTGSPPKSGWPVLFFIHGGWLQIGTANMLDPVALLGQKVFKGIVVAPAYRLNIFGFLGGETLRGDEGSDAPGNFGLWDQRLALEWTYRCVSEFGGNPGEITVAGYSAGAYSVFHQLSYELFMLPREKRVVKRAVMWSNGCGMQPKDLVQGEEQLAEVCRFLGIGVKEGVMRKLRAMSAKRLSEAARSVRVHEFRAVTDGEFVHERLFEAVMSGEFGRRMAEQGVQMVIGECRDEKHVYGSWRPLKVNSYGALQERLSADYSPRAVSMLLREFYCPDGHSLPREETLQYPEGAGIRNWQDAYGAIYADLQVHALERGLLHGIEKGLGMKEASQLVKRYRMEWRASVCDKSFTREVGVTHTTDMAIWFWGNGMGERTAGLLDGDAETSYEVTRPFFSWVEGGGYGERHWQAQGIRNSRSLTTRGVMDLWTDHDWDRGVKVCEIIDKARRREQEARPRL